SVGGSSMVLALPILFIIFGRSKHLKNLGRLTIGPSIFNISEPVMFGAPIVLNPILFVPFMIVPLVVTAITYFAMSVGLVAKPFAIIPWTTPAPFSGVLTTSDWRGGVLMIFNILISLLIYYP